MPIIFHIGSYGALSGAPIVSGPASLKVCKLPLVSQGQMSAGLLTSSISSFLSFGDAHSYLFRKYLLFFFLPKAQEHRGSYTLTIYLTIYFLDFGQRGIST